MGTVAESDAVQRPNRKALVETLQAAADSKRRVNNEGDPFAADPPPEQHAQRAGRNHSSKRSQAQRYSAGEGKSESRRWRSSCNGAGSRFDICSSRPYDDLARKRLELHILQRYDGSNADKLVQEFGISEGLIYEIVRKHRRQRKDQMTLLTRPNEPGLRFTPGNTFSFSRLDIPHPLPLYLDFSRTSP
ncbi:hypothetical protein P4119_17640 [Pseudomonas aeruginosa]|nr:hypothetical protein [Pseudomonas aeruginosa]